MFIQSAVKNAPPRPPSASPNFLLMCRQNAKPSGGLRQKPVSLNWESLVTFVGDRITSLRPIFNTK